MLYQFSFKQEYYFMSSFQIGGPSVDRKLYYFLRRYFYCTYVIIDCYATVVYFPNYAKKRVQLPKKSSYMKVIPAKVPFETVAIDILSELLRSKRSNDYHLVITDFFTKTLSTVPLNRINSAEIAHNVLLIIGDFIWTTQQASIR